MIYTMQQNSNITSTPMVDNNSPSTDLYTDLDMLHTDIELEVDTFREETDIAESSSTLSTDLSALVHARAEAIIAYYTPLFEKITSRTTTQYIDPDFSKQYSEIALDLGYMHIQIDNHAEVIKMYELAAIRSIDPLSCYYYSIVSLRHRLQLRTLFSSSEHSLNACLKSVAKQLSVLFAENSTEALLSSYIKSSVPYSLLIQALEEVKVDTIIEERARYAALSYLYARSGDVEASNTLAGLTLNAGGPLSDSLFMFMSDIYKWW